MQKQWFNVKTNLENDGDKDNNDSSNNKKLDSTSDKIGVGETMQLQYDSPIRKMKF